MRRLVALFSLALFSLLILLYLWWGRFQHFHDLFLAGVYFTSVLLVIGNHLYYRDVRSRLGFRLDNLRQASYLFGGLTAAGLIAIILAGWQWGSFHFKGWKYIGIYIAWAAVQQYLIQNFLRLRSENLFAPAVLTASSDLHKKDDASSEGNSRRTDFPILSTLLAAALFGVYH